MLIRGTALPLPEPRISVEVVTAANLNPKYLDCVPYFIDFWKLMNKSSAVKFNPRVAIIAEEIPKELFRCSENLILISPQRLDPAFVSQVIRIYMAGVSEAQYAMTSDVDMLPLNPKVYEFGIQNLVNSNDFVVLRDVLPAGEFPICYNLASAKTWNQLFINQKNSSPQEFLNGVNRNYNADNSYSGIHGGIGWSIDQRFLYDSVVDSGTTIQIKKFTDVQTGHRRLDRIHHRFPFNWLLLPFVVFGRFSDYHVHHPIQKNVFFVRALRHAVFLRGWKN
jgi:hypothetical protein